MRQSINTPPIQSPLSVKQRLDYLDNLKVALTCLVVAHHAGQPYGGSGGFWYFQPQNGPQIELGRFFAVNAGFFMSLFFLISAYFLPSSLSKKGGKKEYYSIARESSTWNFLPSDLVRMRSKSTCSTPVSGIQVPELQVPKKRSSDS